MKKKGLAATVITLALTVCLVTGCTWKQEKETENIEKELVTVGFSQVGAESDWRTANSVSVKDTFTLERGYNLLFEDARQKQTNQIQGNSRIYSTRRRLYRIFSGCRKRMGYCA